MSLYVPFLWGFQSAGLFSLKNVESISEQFDLSIVLLRQFKYIQKSCKAAGLSSSFLPLFWMGICVPGHTLI